MVATIRSFLQSLRRLWRKNWLVRRLSYATPQAITCCCGTSKPKRAGTTCFSGSKKQIIRHKPPRAKLLAWRAAPAEPDGPTGPAILLESDTQRDQKEPGIFLGGRHR